MKVLVLYASHYGQTRLIAVMLAARLREHGVDSDVVDAVFTQPLPAPDAYDAVVMGSRVELSFHAGSIVQYIERHRDALLKRPTAFFSVSMSAASRSPGFDPDGYMTATFDKVGWRPGIAKSFAGALPYRKYGWFTRFIMKRISKSAGHTTDTSKNHEFTDWDAVRELADQVRAMLPGQVVARRML